MIFVTLLACQDYSYTERRYSQDFLQDEVDSTADLLFVVDDSPSMAEEQELLGVNFESFVAVVEGSYADYQIGVITTDTETETAGMLRGEVLTPDTADLASAFLDAVNVGSYGSRDEQGFAAALMALDGRNPGLVRAGAKLNVVFFSDEDDHSSSDVSTYVEAMTNSSGDARLSVHAIVGDLPEGCASGTSAANAGTRYLDGAERTEGYTDSICAEDYTEILTRIGLDLSGLRDTFELVDLVQPDSLEVWVEDVIIPNRQTNGWQYDAGQNAVVFDGFAVPRPGMKVVVYYAILSGATESASGDTGADTGA